MTYWLKYVNAVKRRCLSTSNPEKGVAYWRDDLFAWIIIYVMPLCLITLLPGLYWSIILKLYVLVATDLLLVLMMLVVAFSPRLNIGTRKRLFIGCSYILSCVLLYYVGVAGPGLIFLLTCCIFTILIFPSRFAFFSAWLNTGICILYGLLISIHLINRPVMNDMLGEWIAVSANVVFLSFLSAALIPRIFKGLQQTLDTEFELKQILHRQQLSLEAALDMLQQKNKELQGFAYVAAHDLNEPLRMITSFMGLLKKKYGNQLDDNANSYIDFALDGGKRMQKLMSDLLDYSQLGRQPEIKEMLDLAELLNDVKQNIFKLVEETGTEIIIPANLPVVNASRSEMSRLFQNLISNGIKFRKHNVGPVIAIAVVEEASAWQFSVTDNGIGIEKGQEKKVFEIFSRLHSKELYAGSGIGLAICKKIVEDYNGKIWLESEEGIGTTFYFLISK